MVWGTSSLKNSSRVNPGGTHEFVMFHRSSMAERALMDFNGPTGIHNIPTVSVQNHPFFSQR